MSQAGRAGHRVIGRAPGLVGALAAARILLVAVAPAAWAHATLLSTSPAADSAVPVSPKAITLTFNQSVTLAGAPVTLASADGHKVAVGPARENGGRSVITGPVGGRLPAGGGTLTLQGVSPHRDVVGSPYPFAVRPPPPALGGAPAAPQPPPPRAAPAP